MGRGIRQGMDLERELEVLKDLPKRRHDQQQKGDDKKQQQQSAVPRPFTPPPPFYHMGEVKRKPQAIITRNPNPSTDYFYTRLNVPQLPSNKRRYSKNSDNEMAPTRPRH